MLCRHTLQSYSLQQELPIVIKHGTPSRKVTLHPVLHLMFWAGWQW